MSDDNWMARAGIEHRVAAMYEEALRRIGNTEELSADVMIAREALARATEVGQRAVIEFELTREQLVKIRRDTIEECAQTVEAIRDGAETLPRYLVLQRIRALAPSETLQDVFRRKLRGP